LYVKEGDVIKALDDLFLHLFNRCCAPCHAKTKFCRAPILFDEVQLAVILWVKITQVSARLDQLLKLGLLRDEIWLQEEDASATAVSAVRGAVKTRALGEKLALAEPQTALPNDDLHALEPVGHGGVVFGEIERMRFAIWERATAHAWTVRMVRPPFLRSCERNQSAPACCRTTAHHPWHRRMQRRQSQGQVGRLQSRKGVRKGLPLMRGVTTPARYKDSTEVSCLCWLGIHRPEEFFEHFPLLSADMKTHLIGRRWWREERGKVSAPFTIFRADMASNARF
jgi:hypothetical protein